MQGRFIGNNIRQLLEAIEHNKLNEKAGLIFITDLEKAFDKANLKFIFLRFQV